MKCLDCKWYKPKEPSKRGTPKGQCLKKTSQWWTDYRYGKTKVCKTYFELKEQKKNE